MRALTLDKCFIYGLWTIISRNEESPIEGIDTWYIPFVGAFLTRVEMRKARLRALTLVWIWNLRKSSAIVEMRKARLRALTPCPIMSSVSIVRSRNEKSPIKSIEQISLLCIMSIQNT